jgi:23S rRNA pseudouridine2605 synthase
MFEEIGHHVEKIKRVKYGPLSLDVPPGEFRRLSETELEKLKVATGVTGPGQKTSNTQKRAQKRSGRRPKSNSKSKPQSN